jgi:hypothetical protein
MGGENGLLGGDVKDEVGSAGRRRERGLGVPKILEESQMLTTSMNVVLRRTPYSLRVGCGWEGE